MEETTVFHDGLECNILDYSHAVFFGHLVFKMQNNLFQIDLGRAYSNARTTSNSSSRDVFGFVQTLIKRSENDTNG